MTLRVTHDEGVAHVVLDAPPLNLLTRGVMDNLREAMTALAHEADLRVVLLEAEGPHFSAGASVAEHLPGEVDDMIPEFMATVHAISSFPLPVVAAVQGRCLGGAFELVLAADVVLAAESALLGVPEIRLGVFPPAACVQLARRASSSLTAELLYTGDPLGTAALAAAGLVSRVVPDEQLRDEAVAFACRIARNSAAALRATKQALALAQPSTDEAMAAVSRLYLDQLMTTADAVEGLTAFMEKRPPQWRHR